MVAGVHVVQGDNQFYSIYTPQGILICQLQMPCDGQIFRDAEALKLIARIMSRRWGVT